MDLRWPDVIVHSSLVGWKCKKRVVRRLDKLEIGVDPLVGGWIFVSAFLDKFIRLLRSAPGEQ